MIDLTHPVCISDQDITLRSIATRVAVTGEPLPKPERPKDMPSVSLLFLLKNEWMTAERAVALTLPFVTEIIIGIDTETDTINAFAFAEAVERKTRAECLEFFSAPERISREVTYEELCEWLGVKPDTFAVELRDKYLIDGHPTRRAAERCLAMVGKGEIIDIDFKNHFSNARNQLLDRCTGDFVFVVDGHEFLTDVWHLMAAFKQAEVELPGFLRMGLMVDMQDSPAKESNIQTRIFRRVPGIHYERGVHNQIIIEGELSNREPSTWDVALVHQRPAFLQYLRVPQRSQMTNTYMGDVGDHHDAYYMAIDAHKCQRWDEAIKWYERYMELNPEGIEAAYVSAMCGFIQSDRLHNLPEAIKAYKRGISCSPQAAFCYLGLAETYIQMGDELDASETIEQADKKYLQEEYYKTALLYAQQSTTCEMPKSTIALPQTAYTFEPKIRLAEAYSRLGDPHLGVYWYGEAINEIPEDDPLKADLELRMHEVASIHYRLRNDARKASSKKTFYLVDSMGQFSEQVAEIAAGLGFEVISDREANVNKYLSCDVCWCDWLDENAFNLSRVFKSDRRLIIRCHSYESFSGIYGTPPASINWDNVDVLGAASNLVARKLQMKYGVPKEKARILPVVPNPENFKGIVIDPTNRDVVIVKRVNYKSGMELLPELARMTPEFTYHLAGTIQDERLYDHLVYQCVSQSINNIKIYGHIESFELPTHLSRGTRFLNLSPWESTPVSLREAQAAGLQVFVLNAEWVSEFPGMIVARNLTEMAAMLKDVPYARQEVGLEKIYEATRKEIADAITGA